MRGHFVAGFRAQPMLRQKQQLSGCVQLFAAHYLLRTVCQLKQNGSWLHAAAMGGSFRGAINGTRRAPTLAAVAPPPPRQSARTRRGLVHLARSICAALCGNGHQRSTPFTRMSRVMAAKSRVPRGGGFCAAAAMPIHTAMRVVPAAFVWPRMSRTHSLAFGLRAIYEDLVSRRRLYRQREKKKRVTMGRAKPPNPRSSALPLAPGCRVLAGQAGRGRFDGLRQAQRV